MMVLLHIDDNKAFHLMKVLEELPYVKTEPLTPYKAEILRGLKESVNELNLIQQGKLTGIPAKELLDEL
ncbi:MAG: hypothetical protein AAGI38_10275 [Bacteroidota bacterium]